MADLCLQHLLDEHRCFERTLAALDFMLAAAKNPQPVSASAWMAAVELVRSLNAAAQLHVQKEEQVLFLELENFLPREMGPLAVLRGEHHDLAREAATLLSAAEALAAAGHVPDVVEQFDRAGRNLLRLVRDHFYKEERVLFPMVARFLSPERDAHLLERMRVLDGSGSGPGAAQDASGG